MKRATTFDLTLKRHIRAPREKVFDAFVMAEHARNWMCPRGMTMPVAEFGVRVGGKYRLTMRARDGDQFSAGGTYREIARPERLAYTWAWLGEGMPDGETLITVALTERDGGTEVVMTHSGFPDAGMRDSHEEGWGSSLNKLCDMLDARGQWVSAINAYVDGPLIRRYVLNYVFPKGAGGKPDRAAIEAAVKEIPGNLATLERAYGGRDFLVGKALSMADLFLAPMLFYVEMFPEGKALLANYPNVMRGQAAMRERAIRKPCRRWALER